ncbi:MAG: carboxypeptidase regulatory-like domain-containing protein, partial [Acidobacteriota bacterium]
GAPGYLTARPSRGTDPTSAAGRGPSVALEPAAVIEGLVVDGDGRPVADADVSISIKRPDTGEIRITIGEPSLAPSDRTGADGRFRLSPVDPDNNYELRVRAAGFAVEERLISGLAPYETRDGVRVVLETGTSVVGVVVTDAEELPVADADVTLTPAVPGRMPRISTHEAGPKVRFEAITDADGAFAVADLAPGRYDVEVSRRGFAKLLQRAADVPEGVAQVDLGTLRLAPGEVVEGFVANPQGEPLEGVMVSVSKPGGMMISMPGMARGEPDARTGPDGWFVVDRLQAGEQINLTVDRPGYVEQRLGGIKPPLDQPLHLELDLSSTLSGIVLDPEGEPLAGADVTLDRRVSGGFGGNVMVMLRRDSETTDSQGRFVFEDLEPGKVTLAAVAPGYQKAERSEIEVPEGEDVEGIELPLDAGAFIVGQVRLSDGRPAAGARVRELREGQERFGLDSVTADGDGFYRLDGITPGTVNIEAKHQDVLRTVREIEARAGANELDLVFEGGIDVSGIVVSTAGAPVAGAWVQLAPAGRPWGGPETTADARGAFRIAGVRDGDYVVRASADGFAPLGDDVRVRVAGEPLTDLEVRLDEGGTISGSISGLDESEMSSVELSAAQIDGLDFRSPIVDRTGEFRIERASPGTWRLVARLGVSGRQASGQVELGGSGEQVTVSLEFGRGLVLSGQVLRNERPLADLTVFAQGTDVARSGWARTDEGGRFAIDDLESGTYRLELRDWETGLTHIETVEMSADVEVEVEIPTASVAGRVVDASDRQPLAGARVRLEPLGETTGVAILDQGATTDLDGRFRVGNVTDGSWRVSVGKKGFAARATTAVVQNGRSVENLELVLDPTEGLTLEVRMATGAIPEQVRLAVLDASGRALISGSHATGENGRVRLSSVPGGSWQLVVGAPGSANVNLDASVPGTLPIVLPAPGTLVVSLPEYAGSNAVATVTLTDERGRAFRSLGWMGWLTDEWRMIDGQLEFRALPPGSWTVRAVGPDGAVWQEMAQLSEGASATVVLE